MIIRPPAAESSRPNGQSWLNTRVCSAEVAVCRTGRGVNGQRRAGRGLRVAAGDGAGSGTRTGTCLAAVLVAWSAWIRKSKCRMQISEVRMPEGENLQGAGGLGTEATRVGRASQTAECRTRRTKCPVKDCSGPRPDGQLTEARIGNTITRAMIRRVERRISRNVARSLSRCGCHCRTGNLRRCGICSGEGCVGRSVARSEGRSLSRCGHRYGTGNLG
jgi:hypothetical protein